jgi:hypothetical protein
MDTSQACATTRLDASWAKVLLLSGKRCGSTPICSLPSKVRTAPRPCPVQSGPVYREQNPCPVGEMVDFALVITDTNYDLVLISIAVVTPPDTRETPIVFGYWSCPASLSSGVVIQFDRQV